MFNKIAIDFRNVLVKDDKPTFNSLSRNYSTGVVIVGGGFSGLITAYFLVKNTNKRISILERGRLVSSSSNHSLGQVMTGYEVGLTTIQKKYGDSVIKEIFKLDKLNKRRFNSFLRELNSKHDGYLKTKIYFTSLDELKPFLHQAKLLNKLGIQTKIVVLDIYQHRKLFQRYRTFVKFVKFIRINKCELIFDIAPLGYVFYYFSSILINLDEINAKIIDFLLKSKRVEIFENTEVNSISKNGSIEVRAMGNKIFAEEVVLATNGDTIANVFPALGKLYSTQFHYVIAMPFKTTGKSRIGGFYKNGEFCYFQIRTLNSQSYLIIGGMDFAKRPTISVLKNRAYRFCQNVLKEGIFDTMDEINIFGERLCYTQDGMRYNKVIEGKIYHTWGCNGIGLLDAFANAIRISNYVKLY